MGPDADKVRQRKPQVLSSRNGSSSDGQYDHDQHQQQPYITTNIDKIKSNEIVIDGIIYNLNTFQHPGGDTIFVFGGNDVTVQYKMIHPYHTAKHLEKMEKVGMIADYTSEYKFDTEFEREIKREVFKIVNRGKEFGTYGWFVRAIAYVSFFFYLQYLWVTTGTSIALAIIYGISQAFIGLNVQHDANHGAASKKPWINDLFGLGADFIGGSKWLWLEQHWTHHTYTNHNIKDPDAYGAEPMILFNNYPLGHPKRKWYHSLQAFYFVIVMAGYWLSSVFNPQVIDLKQRGALEIGIKMENDFIKSRRKYAIMLRLLYIYVNIICPYQLYGSFSWSITGHILLMGAAESLTLALLFALSHNFEHCDRDPTVSVRKTGEPVCWYKSQVETSCTYGSFISGYLTGGLNFQVEHHLFPRMSSAWYPYIAPKVREICKKHNVQYAYYPWVFQNFISTMKYIHKAGSGALWKHFENPLSGRA